MIRAFWAWFASNEQRVRADPQAVVGELEKHLFRICEIGWELGPGDGEDRWAFAIAIPDDADQLELAKQIVAGAPALEHWTISLGKPRRTWQLAFEIELDDGARQLEGTRWEVVVYRFDDGTFDLVLKPDGSCLDLDADTLDHCAEVIVEGELGEATRQRLVGEVEVVRAWDSTQQPSARRLEVGLLHRLLAIV